MKRKTTTTTEEFDENGVLKLKTTEVTEEEDSGFIYPQAYHTFPCYPTSEPCVPIKYESTITCKSEGCE